MTIRAAIYTRISLAEDGDTTKTDDQERICRDLCERLGWEPVAVYCDNGKSAWKRDRKRPGWDAMLAAAEAGKIDAIAIYHNDRLVRQGWDLEVLLRLAEGKGILLASPTGTRSLDNGDDKFVMRLEAAVATRSSDDSSRRKKDQYARWRREGRVRVGGYRAFGFARDGIAHDPVEASIVRELAGRVLTGESVGALVRDLNARGLVTTAGKPWSHIAVRAMLSRPRYAGLMPDCVAPAAWEPILDRGEWERLRAVLAARSAGDRPPGVSPDNTRKYLLSGIATCGAAGCGAGLSIHLTRHGNGRAAMSYSCKSPACRKVARSQPLLDAYVTSRVVARLNHPDKPAPTAIEAGLAAELGVLTRRRAETVATIESLADHPGESLAVLARALVSFDTRIAELRDRMAGDGRERLRERHARLTLDGFKALDLGAQRSLVAACYRVIVLPATMKGPGFNSADILMSPL